LSDVEDQRRDDKGRDARNHGVYISTREIYDLIQKEREERQAQGMAIWERIRAIDIKVWGILVPAALIAAFLVKQMFFK